MADFDYKKYSLERLEEWVNDSLSAAEASPQEIYDVIKKTVEEYYYTYKHHTSRAYELLALLNGNGKGHIKAYDDYVDKVLSCDKNNSSPECKGAWTSFWEEKNYPEEYGLQYTDEEITAMCDAAEKVEQERLKKELLDAKINAKSSFNDGLTREYYQDRVNKLEDKLGVVKGDKVKKWVLPVEKCKDADTDETEYFVSFPDDLLEAANLVEGDQIEWVDNSDGSYLLKKVVK
ncbi:AbrB/MazE/SpoVT family DNA-binding domain-containing protein [Synechococcus phage S-SRM01]|uniref:AbrB/MazE/SpoVT family DNA-binding domain-containing protein n=1 Tax=Synechococcus phage S-SRM01 TaxID=2781608 RepID=A0A879R403_9CAUD|nr:AbrB/MazE/SpoVT family DNA-binding domain-containing protein [Synechococcus phage S-SRM01]QPX48095.1 AbrB/MazE/SpoVT family DNA-binding domain-containing protein [Synechococcus phage S-SRM01]